MKWIELTIFTTEQGLEPVCARLDMLGVGQVAIEQSRESIEKFLNDTAKYWDYADLDNMVKAGGPCVKAYIADLEENRALLEEISTSFAALKGEDVGLDLGSLEIVTAIRDDEDWENNWKLYYKPLKIGQRLLVRPTWEQAEPEGRVVLSLDPGMAFGTGSHHTTRMCLELLEGNIHQGDRVIDLGCGSGILSIAALLLGAERAAGVDIDPVAEKVARENAALNGIGPDKYTLMAGDVLTDGALVDRLCAQEYDLALANIVASVIVELCGILPRMLRPGGLLITSGIIAERLEEVKAALIANGFEVLSVLEGEDWRAVLARRI